MCCLFATLVKKEEVNKPVYQEVPYTDLECDFPYSSIFLDHYNWVCAHFMLDTAFTKIDSISGQCAVKVDTSLIFIDRLNCEE